MIKKIMKFSFCNWYEKLLFTVFMLISTSAQAATTNPFEKLIKIIDVITEALTTQVATAIIGLAVIIGGFMALRGRIPWAWFYGVLASALLISGGSWLAQLFITGAG